MQGFGLKGDFDVEFLPPVSVILKDLALLGLRLRSTKQPLQEAVKKVVIPSFKRTWEAEGRPDAWDELSPYTIQRKTGASLGDSASIGGGAGVPILVSTPAQRELGRHQSSGRGGALKTRATSFKIWSFTKDSAYISGAGIQFYGPIHQLGAPGVGIPARPFLILQTEDLEDIEKVFGEWVDGLGARFAVGV